MLSQRRHIERLGQIWVTTGPVYFLTCCSYKRRPILTVAGSARVIRAAFEGSREAVGWTIGRYVIMPDHVHFFPPPFLDAGQNVSDLVRSFKVFTARRISTLGYQLPIWQREFFDHVLRSGESYTSKWEYVRENPVRAGLISRWDEWPHQGEIFEIPGALW